MRIAILLADDFEDSEFRVPYDRLKNAGFELVVIGAVPGKTVTGKRHKEKVVTDKGIDEVSVDEFDAALIPGGYSPDKLRLNKGIVDFVRVANEKGKLIAAICHGPQLLISADIVRGKTMTSWESVAVDLKNAGANWVDQPVVVDGNIITSRKPSDLEPFSDAILHYLEETRKSSAA